jgi:phospholipid-binding lipoprotein MlaA
VTVSFQMPARFFRRACAGAALALALLSADSVPARAERVPGDPLEPVNRAIFKFNDTLDVWVLEPVAKGWNFIVPGGMQQSLDNFFENLRFPVVFVNSVLQAKPAAAGTALGRFTINTLFGVVGLFDPAQAAGLQRVDEDFGQTLGRWGLGGGPYLVLPLLGPSNVRDGVGLGVDAVTRVWPYFVEPEVVWAVTGINVVNTRSLYLDVVRDAKRDSLDYYSAVRDAYLQRRADLIADRLTGDNGEEPETGDDDDLYYPEESGDDDLYYPEVD